MGYTDFIAIAVVSDAKVPVAPSGFCRQYLIDFDEGILVIMADAKQGNIVEMTAGELLPLAFSAQKLSLID
jgi:cytidine deaminase